MIAIVNKRANFSMCVNGPVNHTQPYHSPTLVGDQLKFPVGIRKTVNTSVNTKVTLHTLTIVCVLCTACIDFFLVIPATDQRLKHYLPSLQVVRS